jgi:hypothetical protein
MFDAIEDPRLAERRHVAKRPDGQWQTNVRVQREQASFDPRRPPPRPLRRRTCAYAWWREVVIHRLNGQIRDSDTINRADPNPPKDKKH